jgi:hypothetical protein
MALTAFSCMSGSMWEYVSIVMEMFACPSISCTILGCVPLDSRSVAHVCLRSWNLIRGKSVRFRSGVVLSGSTYPPSRLPNRSFRPSRSSGRRRPRGRSRGGGGGVGRRFDARSASRGPLA